MANPDKETRVGQNKNAEPQFDPITQGQFYLAMTETAYYNEGGISPGVRNFFVGQERPYQQLRSALTQSPPGTLIAVSGPNGSGKDSILDAATIDLINEGVFAGEDVQSVHVEFDLKEGVSFYAIDRVFSWVSKPQGIPPKILYINEVSYFNQTERGDRYTKEWFKKQLGIAGKFLGKEAPIIVLLGDDAVKDPEILTSLESPYEPIQIELDPLTPELLIDALKERVGHALQRPSKQIDLNSVFDQEAMDALIPTADYPIANMRSTLTILWEVATHLSPNEESLRLTREAFSRKYSEGLYQKFWRTAPEEEKGLISLLIQYVDDHKANKTPMNAMDIEDIARIYSNDSVNDYPKLIRNMLYRDVLKKVQWSPALYLPSQHFFLAAATRELPLDPQSREGKHEIGRLKEELVLDRLLSEGAKSVDAWEENIRRMKLIYGWDEEFSRTLLYEHLENLEDFNKNEAKIIRGRIHGN